MRKDLNCIFVFFPLQLREEAGAETISGKSLSSGPSTVTGQSEEALSQGQYRCVEPSERGAQENRTGERQKSNHSETVTDI